MDALSAISILISKYDPADCREFDINLSIFPGSPKDIKLRSSFSDLYDFYDYIKTVSRYSEIFNFSLKISDVFVYWNQDEGLIE